VRHGIVVGVVVIGRTGITRTMPVISLANADGQRRFKEARATLRTTLIRVDLSGYNVTK